MQSRYSYLIKNTGILAISNFSSKILAFLLVPLYTSVLTTDEYGTYDIISTTIQLLIPILTVNICDAIVRYLMDEGLNNEKIIAIGRKFCVLGIVLFTVFIIFNRVLGIVSVLSKFVVMTIALFISTVFYQYTTSIAKGLEKVKDMGVAGVLSTIVMIFFNIVFLVYLRFGITGFFLASIFSQFLPAIFLYFRLNLRKYNHFLIDKKIQLSMVHYSSPLILNIVGWWMNNALDRYVVSFICGTAVNGIFSVAYKIPNILAVIQQIFMQAWQISAIKEYSKDSKEFYGKMINFINIVMGITCMVLVLTTKILASFLYANDFYRAWKYVPCLLVSGVFNSVSGVLGPILSADKNSKALGLSTFYGAVVNVVFNILLVYVMGAQGATIATLMSSFAIYFFRSRALADKIEFENKNIMFASWLLLIVQAFVMAYLENYILQILIICIYITMYRKDLTNLLIKTAKHLKNYRM